jgi:hypothetical protein
MRHRTPVHPDEKQRGHWRVPNHTCHVHVRPSARRQGTCACMSKGGFPRDRVPPFPSCRIGTSRHLAALGSSDRARQEFALRAHAHQTDNQMQSRCPAEFLSRSEPLQATAGIPRRTRVDGAGHYYGCGLLIPRARTPAAARRHRRPRARHKDLWLKLRQISTCSENVGSVPQLRNSRGADEEANFDSSQSGGNEAL